jgi:hypothetical protein
MKSLIKKILRESYEDFVFQDIMTRDRDDVDRIKYNKILKQIESPESDEGEKWSSKERDFLKKSLSKNNVSGYKEISDRTKNDNELKTTISKANTAIDKVNYILNSESHKSKDYNCVSNLSKLSDELSNVIDNPKNVLLKGNGIKIIESIIKDINKTIINCNFLYKN